MYTMCVYETFMEFMLHLGPVMLAHIKLDTAQIHLERASQ